VGGLGAEGGVFGWEVCEGAGETGEVERGCLRELCARGWWAL
jgi:hypothetical protein